MPQIAKKKKKKKAAAAVTTPAATKVPSPDSDGDKQSPSQARDLEFYDDYSKVSQKA